LSHFTDINRLVIGIPSYGYYGPTGSYTITRQTAVEMESLPGYSTASQDSSSYEMNWANEGVSYFYSNTNSLNAKRTSIEAKGILYISVFHLGGNDWFSGKLEPIGGYKNNSEASTTQAAVPQTTTPVQTTAPRTTVAQTTVAQTTAPRTTVQTTTARTTAPQTTTPVQTTAPRTTTAVPATTIAANSNGSGSGSSVAPCCTLCSVAREGDVSSSTMSSMMEEKYMVTSQPSTTVLAVAFAVVGLVSVMALALGAFVGFSLGSQNPDLKLSLSFKRKSYTPPINLPSAPSRNSSESLWENPIELTLSPSSSEVEYKKESPIPEHSKEFPPKVSRRHSFIQGVTDSPDVQRSLRRSAKLLFQSKEDNDPTEMNEMETKANYEFHHPKN